MENAWAIDSNESDVILKSRHSLIGYLPGNTNNLKGHVAIQNNEVEDASIEFSLNVNNKKNASSEKNEEIKLTDLFDEDETPLIQFKSTSFQKINKNINFLKGLLTIKNITKVVEFDTEFIGFNNYNGVEKASFEITGNINRKDFGLNYNMISRNRSNPISKDIKLIANLEFTH
ncbi:YceI family protein [Flavobacterium sp. 5]|uniref:YceI family protein n=1 Tax=Flavobacterium sp. 5 TaxID=2035199 RepID=UPI000C2C917C|nr:YceI family protein [Flavobacterium sp. 5]PKB16387.1 polyisoprenoid-binding protein YceI [Flavobacterium sp. 5]